MGCARQSGAPLAIRLRSSFYTAAAACALLALLSCLPARGGAEPGRAARERLSGHRRLDKSSYYPADALLTEPYRDDPNRWLVIFHCVGIGYMLLGLNTVCDVYFTGALDWMVDRWKITPDVAGATFMAAGGSAPELFASLIGSTIAVNDVGFSTIVGSAVFNVLFVIGLCGYLAKEEIALTWWPLFRDCSYYIFALSILAACAADEEIGLAEAVVLFVLYLIYCTIMYFNSRIETMVDAKIRKAKKQVAPADAYLTDGQTSGNSLMIAGVNPSTYGKMKEEPEPDASKQLGLETGDMSPTSPAPSSIGVAVGKTGTESSNVMGSEQEKCFLDRPEGDTKDFIIWCLCLPVYVPIYYCVPWPSERYFLLTFVASLFWIAGFSFLLVWWTEILGQVLHIPTVIMGFTLLAAGTSIPDAVSSVAVARAGEGDMAVSSSIGSNIFDILVGLPIPWTIKILIEDPLHHKIRVRSPYLTFYVILLLFMVFLVILCIHFLGWKLNKTLGFCMAGLYVIFLAAAVTVETTEPGALRLGRS